MKRYRVQSLGALKELYERHTKAREAEIRGARERAARRALPKIKERVPHASNELRDSLEVQVTPRTVRIASDAPHFMPVDQGSRPHFPPIEPLIQWCILKGFEDPAGAAYAIQQKIGRDGTKPSGFVAESLDDVLDALKEEVEAALQRMP